MSSSSFGALLRVTTFGESHGPALGAVVDGMPAGLDLDDETIQRDLDRRRPGRSELASSRRESDRARILSGVFEGRTTGAPVAILIENQDADPSAYEAIKDLYRPGHADFAWDRKFGVRDWRGGGRSSGRETAARVAAGALARLVLSRCGAEVIGAVTAIAGVEADPAQADFKAALDHPLRCSDPEAAEQMERAIRDARAAGDSVGGIVEVRANGVPAGWGEPVFDKLDARLAAALMSIGAVKGIEIGDGFALARERGSRSNDAIGEGGRFRSNRAGGILGGISNGEQIRARVAVKPTPSISAAQDTINLRGEPRRIEVDGRHDPCIAPRLVPVAEAMVCLVLADAALVHRARESF
jgi:chorismate synthase